MRFFWCDRVFASLVLILGVAAPAATQTVELALGIPWVEADLDAGWTSDPVRGSQRESSRKLGFGDATAWLWLGDWGLVARGLRSHGSADFWPTAASPSSLVPVLEMSSTVHAYDLGVGRDVVLSSGFHLRPAFGVTRLEHDSRANRYNSWGDPPAPLGDCQGWMFEEVADRLWGGFASLDGALGLGGGWSAVGSAAARYGDGSRRRRAGFVTPCDHTPSGGIVVVPGEEVYWTESDVHRAWAVAAEAGIEWRPLPNLSTALLYRLDDWTDHDGPGRFHSIVLRLGLTLD